MDPTNAPSAQMTPTGLSWFNNAMQGLSSAVGGGLNAIGNIPVSPMGTTLGDLTKQYIYDPKRGILPNNLITGRGGLSDQAKLQQDYAQGKISKDEFISKSTEMGLPMVMGLTGGVEAGGEGLVTKEGKALTSTKFNPPDEAGPILDQRGNPIKSPEPVTEPQPMRTGENIQTEAQPQPRPERLPATRTYTPGKVSSADLLENQKRNIQIDGRDIQTPAQVEQINSTLNGYGIKGTGAQQLQMANDKIADLSKQAKQIIANEGGVTSRASLIKQTAQNMSLSGNHAVPGEQVPFTSQSYIDSLYARATGADLTKSITGAPDFIPDTVVADMKKFAAQDAASTFDRTDPTKWTANQATSRFARDAIDTTLDTAHPNASTLNNDMKDLYDAQDALRKQSNLESGAAYKSAMGQQPPLLKRILTNPLAVGAEIVGGMQVAPHLPEIASTLGGGMLAGAKKAYDVLSGGDNANAKQSGQEDNGVMFHVDSVPQDPKTGNYLLPENPGVTPLTPGTPEYTRAQNSLSGGARQFMQNAPQYMSTVNQVNSDVKGGMPLNIMTLFKSAQDVSAYLSDPKSPYAKQLADVGKLNSQFRAAYTAVTGEKPDDSQMLSPGNSAEQFSEKYKEMVKFIHDNFAQFQVPYLQTSEAPQSFNAPGGPQTQYQQPQASPNAASIMGGNMPALNLPPVGLPSLNNAPGGLPAPNFPTQ
ncbi:MAG: hypothetical protein KGI72_05155 [Patescibacteria group bacterium]|nr:hypothetical protein [Patescibacteria group bacterium]